MEREPNLVISSASQRIVEDALPPSGPRNHRPDGPKAGHALTIKLDHSGGSDHGCEPRKLLFGAVGLWNLF